MADEFLNGYDMTGRTHLTYQQAFHRETSLTRWGGGLENYGASFSYFEYLWEQGRGQRFGEPSLRAAGASARLPDGTRAGDMHGSSSDLRGAGRTAWPVSQTADRSPYNTQTGPRGRDDL